jgi:predicted nuclease of predicted toxin-antitoxin system
VRLLFDQNLSRRLVRLLADLYPDSQHVVDVHLDAADDRAVWEFAKEHGLTIVSKDADFRQLSFLFGHPPKTVWLRIGNSPTGVAADLLRSSSLVIAGFLDDAESALLILPAIN